MQFNARNGTSIDVHRVSSSKHFKFLKLLDTYKLFNEQRDSIFMLQRYKAKPLGVDCLQLFNQIILNSLKNNLITSFKPVFMTHLNSIR